MLTRSIKVFGYLILCFFCLNVLNQPLKSDEVRAQISDNIELQTPTINHTRTLEQEHLRAETENLWAQAVYYRSQANTSGVSIAALLQVLSTALGVLIAFFSIRFQAKHNAAAETLKWERSRADERAKAELAAQQEKQKQTIIAAADLMQKTAIATQHLTWLLWIAKHEPTNCTQKLLNEHNTKMSDSYLQIAGAQVLLSAHDKELMEETNTLVRAVYGYDALVGKYSSDMSVNPEQAIYEMGELWAKVYNFSKELPKKFADALEQYNEQYR